MRIGCSLCSVLGIVGAVIAIGCHEISGLADFEARPIGGTGGVGGTGGSGGAGGEVPVGPNLMGGGVLARYFLDEKSEGDPDEFLDASGALNHLEALGEANMQYTSDAGHRGLRWELAGDAGRGQRRGVADSLHQTTTATIEVVMALPGVAGPARILHVGGDIDNGALAFARDNGGLVLRLDLEDVARWTYDASTRHVVHVRIDLAEPMQLNKAQLFNDGVLVATAMTASAAFPATFTIFDETWLFLGNRGNSDRSPMGVIHYLALYSEALTDEEIANNVTELRARDDGPAAN
jgi:hypothetical protein